VTSTLQLSKSMIA